MFNTKERLRAKIRELENDVSCLEGKLMADVPPTYVPHYDSLVLAYNRLSPEHKALFLVQEMGRLGWVSEVGGK